MAKFSAQRQRLLVVVLMLLAGAAVAYWYFYVLQWEEKAIDGGWSDAARRNPFLAAQQFLEQRGHEVRVLNSFSVFDSMAYGEESIGTQDLVVLIDGYGALQGRRAEQVWQWLNGGGSLVVSTRNPFINLSEQVQDELVARLPVAVGEFTDEADAGLLKLFVEALGGSCPSNQSITISAPATDFEIALREGAAITPNANLNLLWHQQEPPHRLVRFRQGDGWVTVSANNNIWHNRSIGCFDHAYALGLLAEGRERVWIILNTDAPSLWQLLWRRVPVALILLGLALAGALWLASRRVVPATPRPSTARRRFIEHLQGSAAFLWRHQQQQVLAEQLRQDVLRQINRRYPGFAHKTRAQRLELVSQASGLDAEQVEMALWRPLSAQPDEFTIIIKYLQYLSQQFALGQGYRSESGRHNPS